MLTEGIWNEVSLYNVDREYKFPFPVKTIGFTSDHCMERTVFTNKLEIAIRIASLEEYSQDIIDGTCYECKFPNVAFKVPGIAHEYEIAKPRDAFYFSYDSQVLESLKIARLIPELPVWEIKLSPKVTDLIFNLKNMMENSLEYSVSDRIDIMAFQLLEELLFMQRQQDSKDEYIESRINKVHSYLRLNFDSEIDFDELIRENGFSRRSFFRHWNTYFNLTPKLFVQNLRLKEAARLLVETDLKVYEITKKLDYRDSAYFCAIFKKHYGVTPLEFRQVNKR